MSVASVPYSSTDQTPERILQRLDWKVIRRLDGLLQGNYRTLFYGQGLEFSDLREYQEQDDIRHIDWNVTARMNRLHVRQFLEDREVTAWFLVDLSPSMGFGSADRSKEMVLVDLVSTLARLLTRNGNKVGAVLYGERILGSIPPRSGRIQVLRLIHELLRKQSGDSREMTDLNVLLSAALNVFRSRSLVFLISDFISLPGWQAPLSYLNRRHELVCIRLWDEREVQLPNAGLVFVEDSETGEQMYVDTTSPEFRRRFYQAAQEREEQLQNQLKKAGVGLYPVSTQEDLVGALFRMAKLRAMRRQ